MRATRKRYTEEFKTEALALLDRDDRSYQQLSDDLGVAVWTLRHWYKQREMSKKNKGRPSPKPGGFVPPKDETPEQKLARLERDNERLRRQNEQLLMDREILKKAAAFFAREKE
jgi:transposase